MKKVKFRVWCESRKEMLKIQRHSFKTNKSMPYGWNIQYEFDDLMQYTGLVDKNGIEIYEGDLIPYHFNEDIKGIVRFGEYKNPCDDKQCSHVGFYLEFNDPLKKDIFRKDLGYWVKVSTVVGNIYENK